MQPWEAEGKSNPTKWERIVWYRRWLLWTNEMSDRQERQIEEMELRRLRNG